MHKFLEALIQPCRVELEIIFASDVEAISNKSAEAAFNLQLRCLRCASDFQGEEELKTHILLGVQSMSGEKNELEIQRGNKQVKINRIQCNLCLRTFATTYISRHMKIIHESEIRCKSSRCVSFFYTEAERLEHEVEVHNGGQWTKCVYCGNLFGRRKGLLRHVQYYHTDVAIKCDFHSRCVEFFLSKSEKNEHILQVHKTGWGRIRCKVQRVSMRQAVQRQK
jgi:uncharacterized C2H2 Zn-finger protein